MLDRAATYRTSQVLTATPVERVVLLYRGAIRFATLQIAETQQGHREAAHNASLRAQEIVSALRESLDLSAGALPRRLDGLYDFCLRRLMEGNLRRSAGPAGEAVQVLQGLLEAWIQISGAPAPQSARVPEQAALSAAMPADGVARVPASRPTVAAPVGAGRLVGYTGAHR